MTLSALTSAANSALLSRAGISIDEIPARLVYQPLPDGTTRFSRDGQPLRHFMGTSTFAEYTVMPEIALARIDPAAGLDRVCVLACGATTGIAGALWKASSTLSVTPGLEAQLASEVAAPQDSQAGLFLAAGMFDDLEFAFEQHVQRVVSGTFRNQELAIQQVPGGHQAPERGGLFVVQFRAQRRLE